MPSAGGEPASSLVQFLRDEGLSLARTQVKVDYSYWPAHTVLQVHWWVVVGGQAAWMSLPVAVVACDARQCSLQGWMPPPWIPICALCETCWGRQPMHVQRLLPEGIEVPSSFETVGHIAHLNLREELLPHKHTIGQVRGHSTAAALVALAAFVAAWSSKQAGRQACCGRRSAGSGHQHVRSEVNVTCAPSWLSFCSGHPGQEPAPAHRSQQGGQPGAAMHLL